MYLMEGRSRGHASNELRDILDFKKNLTVHCTIFFLLFNSDFDTFNYSFSIPIFLSTEKNKIKNKNKNKNFTITNSHIKDFKTPSCSSYRTIISHKCTVTTKTRFHPVIPCIR